jgi:error-prone DNA polymerase
VAVTGKLQNESGVIHIVAEHIEDMTALLSRLVNDQLEIDTQAGNPGLLPNVRGHPRSGDALVTLLKDDSELETVMPKGRNFH